MKSHEEKDYTFFMTLNLKRLAKLNEEERQMCTSSAVKFQITVKIITFFEFYIANG